MRVKWWELIRLVITIGKLSKIIGLNRFFFMTFPSWSFFPLQYSSFFSFAKNVIYQQIPMYTLWVSSSLLIILFSIFIRNSTHCTEMDIKTGSLHFSWCSLENSTRKINIMLNIEHITVFAYRLFQWQTHS